MADDFNPYHVWLGIPPEEQPANHYRLLSLRLFEISADVIDNAADRQMAHLRTIQVGKHVDLSQRLLNEVAAARICLLDPKNERPTISNFEPNWRQLRLPLQAEPNRPPPAVRPSSASLLAAQPARFRRRRRRTFRPPRRCHSSRPIRGTICSASPTSNRRPARAASRRNRPRPNVAQKIATSSELASPWRVSRRWASGMLLLNGSSIRRNARVRLAGQLSDRHDRLGRRRPLAVPASGPWEYRYPRRIASHRRGASGLQARHARRCRRGQQQAVPPDWKPKAMLVLSWPLGLRSGAELKIDGRAQTISQHDPMEVPVEPGRRTIQITRRGL